MPPMNLTKESIKEWLASHPSRDRTWLAEQCGVSKNTVNNWLSTSIAVPAKASRLIENLMRADLEAARSAQPTPDQNLVLEVRPETFDRYNRAALARQMIVREWAITVLDEAARRAGPSLVTPDQAAAAAQIADDVARELDTDTAPVSPAEG